MTGIANVDQYQAWNGDSGRRWASEPDRRDRVLAPVARVLLETADLRPGERVLDIGCGCGATALLAARVVGPAGEVTGLDLSEPMLVVARHRAEASGAGNLTFEHADAQTHPFEDTHFDAAVSRFGTMFFADPPAAFANIARALRPGGRVCIVTWQPLEANEWLTVPGAALSDFAPLPDNRGTPGMFGQADADVIHATLTAAGFEAVVVAPRSVRLELGADVEKATAYIAESGPVRSAFEAIADAERPAALEALRTALAERLTIAGVQLGAAIFVTTARRG